MNLSLAPQVGFIIAGFLALVASILTFYIFALNPRSWLNRATCTILLLFSLTNLAISLALYADTAEAARIPLAMMTALAPTNGPGFLLLTVLLIKPKWFSGKGRWIVLSLVLLIALPILLTIIDIVFGMRLYYTGFDPVLYAGGILPTRDLTRSFLGRLVSIIDMILLPIITLGPLLFLSFWDKVLHPSSRRLARVLLATQVVATILSFSLIPVFGTGLMTAFLGAIYVVAFAFVTFQTMQADRSSRRGRLHFRLTWMVLIITIPTIVFIAFVLSLQTQRLAEQAARSSLELSGRDISSRIEQWLDLNVKALSYLVSSPELTSMDSARQEIAVRNMAANYPAMYLVSTTDLRGINIARSDGKALLDYSDREWFQIVLAGKPMAYQVLIGRTSGSPALVVAMPIRDVAGNLAGVGMFASELIKVSEIFASQGTSKTGFSYLVDDQNHLVAHSHYTWSQAELVDYGAEKPVAALRSGISGLVKFTDDSGDSWQAYIIPLANQWAVVVQQQEAELMGAMTVVQYTSVIAIILGSLVLLGLTWVTMRQAFRPIDTLNKTVEAITHGDLSRNTPIESEDEIGVLAQAFNSMTGQLREMIISLERRVAERTRDLEKRSTQLQAAAEVGRAVATIRDLDQLLSQVTHLISDQFGFYHVGIFMLDENGENAVLRAANSPGGERMLARHHQLKVGKQGIVGFVTGNRVPRIALNVGQDAVYFNNPDLPDTQSEMALPLIVSGELLGALDVQSKLSGDFGERDIETLQVLADQVAIAISNARLVQRTEQALAAERRAIEKVTRQSWGERFQRLSNLAFVRNQNGLTKTKLETEPLTLKIIENGIEVEEQVDSNCLVLPVKVRGQVIGMIKTRKPVEAGPWTPEEKTLLEQLVDQIGMSLDVARLYEETQLSAEHEHTLSQITAKVRASTSLDVILQTALQELAEALHVPKGSILLKGGNGVHSDE